MSHIAKYLFILPILAGCHSNAGIHGSMAEGRCYYVTPSGDNHNPGTRSKPWKTAEMVSKADLNPGDTVLFEGGSRFEGTIRLDSLDSGKDGKHIKIGSYGFGKPVIDGGLSEGIVVSNCNYINISDLIVKGTGRKDGNITDGILITNSKHLSVTSIEVSGFQHSGLHIHGCSNLKIEQIYAHENGFAGINVSGNTAGDSLRYDNVDIYIGHCLAENNPGDPTVKANHSGNGILAASVRSGVIEYCEAFNNGWDMPWTGNGPVGIWIWDCTDFKIQYCISHDNKTNPVAADGGGFDLDGGVSNSLIQYCLSYNNQGAGYGLFEFGAAKAWENNTLRYNISFNDGSGNGGSVAIWRSTPELKMRNCEIYNNTFYNTTKKGFSLSIENNCPGFNFCNNIFVYSGAFLKTNQKLVSEQFRSNCYWNLSTSSSFAGYNNIKEWAKITSCEMAEDRFTGIVSDPGLQDPAGFSLVKPMKPDSLNIASFRLKPDSPLIDKGLDMKREFNIDPGVRDIEGIKLPQYKGYDIGAIEFIKVN